MLRWMQVAFAQPRMNANHLQHADAIAQGKKWCVSGPGSDRDQPAFPQAYLLEHLPGQSPLQLRRDKGR